MINLLIEIKDKIPDEIYDILFLMLSFNPAIRPDISKIWALLNTRYYFKIKYNAPAKESEIKGKEKTWRPQI